MKEIANLSNKRITIDRNEFLKMKGSFNTNIYFVESGSLSAFVLDKNRTQLVEKTFKTH